MNIEDIKGKIRLIDDSVAAIRQHKSEQFETRFRPLVMQKCRLRKMLSAATNNPAIAAYGESQKGKSYLMNNLLQKEGRPFMVMADGQEFNFVDSINPPGEGREATGVVTRFTSFRGEGQEQMYSAQFPVLVKLFSVADIVSILVDGYFSDLSDAETFPDEQIAKAADEIYERYRDRRPIDNPPMDEGDVYDIRYYIKNFILKGTKPLWRSSFFDKVALVIRNIPVEDYDEVFSILWLKTEKMTELFIKLVHDLQQLHFAKYVYLPISSVLHKGVKKDTIMSVDCLKLLYSDEVMTTDVYLKTPAGFSRVAGFNKSDLSALCAEVAFKIEDEYLEGTLEYDRSMFSGSTDAKVSRSGVKKDLLKYSDLLDFPGARNRLELKTSFLDKVDTQDKVPNMVKVLLRGKVAFLFNKYSDSRAINILLFCHDGKNVEVTKMYSVIEQWINTYVGDTPERRRKTIENAGGIPPMFVVGTKFNMDMVQEDSPDKNNFAALSSRWDGRFEALYKDCFEAGNVDWFENWTAAGETFKNTYMLRDYKYSSCMGGCSNLYDGYRKSDPCPREDRMVMTESFYATLKKSFVENAYVAKFFSSPERAWDLSATINNDGSVYIIEQLTSVARNMGQVRTDLFDQEMRDVSREVRKIMENYWVDPKQGDDPREKIRIARSVQREFDFVSNEDSYFFGRFLHQMQLSDRETYDAVHRIVKDPSLIEDVSTAKDGEIIRKRVRFDKYTEPDQRWQRFIDIYGFSDKAEAHDYLVSKGFADPDAFMVSEDKKKANSIVIAERIYKMWLDKVTSPEILNSVMSESSFDQDVMTKLLENMHNVADYLDLSSHMAEAISSLVDTITLHTANEYLVTDILRTIINSFVNDFGYSFRTPGDIANCHSLSDQNDLELFQYIEAERKSSYSEAELTDLFNDLAKDANALTQSYMTSLSEWLEYMFVSFIGSMKARRPIDKEFNDKVGVILEGLK